MALKRYPLFQVFIAFSAGILWANFFEVSITFSLAFLGISALLLLVSGLVLKKPTLRKSKAFGVLAAAVFLSLGLVLSYGQGQHHLPHHYRSQEPGSAYKLKIISHPTASEKTIKAKAELEARYHERQAVPSTGKVLLYFEKDSLAMRLSYGDRISFRGKLNPLQGPQNPYEFDYKNYLNLQAIYAQAYLPARSWKLTEKYQGHNLKSWSIKARTYLLDVIRKWPLSTKERTVTQALLLGYRYDIEDDVLRAYSAAGATHVLAVSGLHVGIVYLLTYYLLFFVDRVKHGKVIRTALLVLLLWAYAMITGLSPSVVRAATMFSFVAVGTAFKRPTSIYNTLLASAMVLLIIKPTYLFEVGFQLSYLAVLGIVWLQPRFEGMLNPKGWVLKQLWTITTVSLAAQIATFPLGLYYFHQFPALFLISNLLVIPLVTVLMYIGLVGLILSASGWLVKPLIHLYNLVLQLMNKSVEWVEGWTWFLIDQIHISRLEMVLIYLMIGFGFAWLFQGKLWRLRATVAMAVFLVAMQVIENYQLQNRSEITFYALRKNAAISFLSAGRGVLLADSALQSDEDALTFHIRHHVWANNILNLENVRWQEDFENHYFRCENGLIHFQNHTIWKYRPGYELAPTADVWLIDRQSGKPLLEEVPATVVLLKQIRNSQRESWKQWALENRVLCKDLSEGYYQIEL